MKQTYAFCCNDNKKLLLSTPVIGAGEALSYTSSDFDGSEFSLGIRFIYTGGGTSLIYCNQSDGALNWSIYVGANLAYYDPTNGEIVLFPVSQDTVYHVWIDLDADDLDVYWQEEGGTRNYSNFAISTNTASDSTIYLGTNYDLDDPFSGTLWDFAYSSAKNSSASTYIPGGMNMAWTYYWPMREGAGLDCYDIIQGADLGVTSGFSWTGDDTDDPKRWA